jgi:hypothetical protein
MLIQRSAQTKLVYSQKGTLIEDVRAFSSESISIAVVVITHRVQA